MQRAEPSPFLQLQTLYLHTSPILVLNRSETFRILQNIRPSLNHAPMNKQYEASLCKPGPRPCLWLLCIGAARSNLKTRVRHMDMKLEQRFRSNWEWSPFAFLRLFITQ